jgi:hypothetical protein
MESSEYWNTRCNCDGIDIVKCEADDLGGDMIGYGELIASPFGAIACVRALAWSIVQKVSAPFWGSLQSATMSLARFGGVLSRAKCSSRPQWHAAYVHGLDVSTRSYGS